MSTCHFNIEGPVSHTPTAQAARNSWGGIWSSIRLTLVALFTGAPSVQRVSKGPDMKRVIRTERAMKHVPFDVEIARITGANRFCA